MGIFADKINTLKKEKTISSGGQNRFLALHEKYLQNRANKKQQKLNAVNNANPLNKNINFNLGDVNISVPKTIPNSQNLQPSNNEQVNTPLQQETPQTANPQARDSLLNKVGGYLKPVNNLLQKTPQAIIDTGAGGVGLVSGIFGALVGGATGFAISSNRERLKGGYNYKRVWKDTIDSAKKTAKFGQQVGRSGTKTAPLYPILGEVFLTSIGKGIYHTFEDIGRVYEEMKMNKVPNAKTRAIYYGQKRGSVEGLKLLGLDERTAQYLSKNDIMAGVGNLILYGGAYLGARGSAAQAKGQIEKLPFLKVKKTGNTMVIPADEYFKRYLSNRLKGTTYRPTFTKDGVEIALPRTKLTPKQIAETVAKSPSIKGFFDITEYKRTPFGKLFRDVKDFRKPELIYKQEYLPERTGLSEKNQPGTRAIPVGEPQTNEWQSNINFDKNTLLTESQAPKITQPKESTLLNAGKASYPPLDTPNAQFQIVNEKAVKSLKRLVNKLEKAKKEKQAVIASGKENPQEAKASVDQINKSIEKIKQRIAKREQQRFITTGPTNLSNLNKKDISGRILTTPPIQQTIQQPEPTSKKIKVKVIRPVGKPRTKVPIKIEKRPVGRPKSTLSVKEIYKKRQQKKAANKTKSYAEILRESQAKEAKNVKKPTRTPEQIRADLAKEREQVSIRRENAMASAKETNKDLKKAEENSLRNHPLNKELQKELKAGKDENHFVDKAFNYFTEGKTVESNVIDKFIQDNFGQEYSSKKKGGLNIFDRIKNMRNKEKNKPLNFKSESIRLILKYGNRVSEKYTPKNAAGIAYKNKNISVKSLTDVSTVIHELAHIVDNNGDLAKTLTKNEFAYKQEIKDLKDIYLKYYPQSTPSASRNTKITEGLATLVELKISNPDIANQYSVTKKLFKEGGSLYNPLYTDLIKDGIKISERYSDLDALKQIGARMYHGEKRETVKKNFINLKDKIKIQIVNNLWAWRKIGKVAGVEFNAKNPYLYLEHFNVSGYIANNNVLNEKNGYWTRDHKDGSFFRKYKFNWASLTRDIKDIGAEEEFGQFLIARATYYDYKLLDSLKDGEEKDALADVLKNDNIDRELATKAYKENRERFATYAKQFDILNDEDLILLHNPFVRKINDKQFEKLKNMKGYAPRRRTIMDEFANGNNDFKFYNNHTKVNSLIARKGSQKEIINPLMQAQINHMHIMKATTKQMIWNKLYELVDYIPYDIVQVVPVQMNKIGDKMTFKDSNNPDALFAIDKNYKVKELILDKELSKALSVAFDKTSFDFFEQIIKKAAKLFVKGTTGAYLPYSPINAGIDSFSAFGQSNNKLIPLVDSIKQTVKYAMEKGEGIETDIIESFFTLGGHNTTFLRSRDETPEEYFKRVTDETNLFKKVVYGAVKKGFDIISAPQQGSEIMTRLAEYRAAILAGKPQIVALAEASKISGTFGNLGRWGGQVGRTVVQGDPYTNATIQIADTYLEAAGNKTSRGRLLFMLAMITALHLTSWALLYKSYKKALKIGGKELDNFNKILQQRAGLNVYEQGNYLYFSDIKNAKTYKVRVPGEQGVIGGMFNLVLANKYASANYTGKDFANLFFGAYTPQQFNVFDNTWIFNILPQAVRTEVLVKANKKIFPTEKKIEPDYMQYLPPEDRYYKNTNNLAVILGKLLHQSPLKIEARMLGYFGRAFDMYTENIGKSPQTYLDGIIKRFTNSVNVANYLFSNKIYSDFEKKKTKAFYNYKRDKVKYNNEYHITKSIQNIITAIEKINNLDIKIPVEYEVYVNSMLMDINKDKYDDAIKKYIILIHNRKFTNFMEDGLIKYKKEKIKKEENKKGTNK